MRMRSSFVGRFLLTGALLLLCLAVTACGPKVLENIQYREIQIPEGMLTCAPKPSVPSLAALEGPDGDNVLSVYIARVEFARRDCECAVKELKAFVDKVPPPEECKEKPDDSDRSQGSAA